MGKPTNAPCVTIPKSCKGRRVRSLVTGRWYATQDRRVCAENDSIRWKKNYKKLIPSQRIATKASTKKEVKLRQGASQRKVFMANPQLWIDPASNVTKADPFVAYEMCEREKTVGVSIDV